MAALFDNPELGGQRLLNNRIVMAPMTRTRASEGDVANALMATYYGQRASAGLIVTEATDVSARRRVTHGPPASIRTRRLRDGNSECEAECNRASSNP
jgi:2,4-dienoyl-CoA reductase-like NADH-dependent reductase (Old Yellow Enzyme family)